MGGRDHLGGTRHGGRRLAAAKPKHRRTLGETALAGPGKRSPLDPGPRGRPDVSVKLAGPSGPAFYLENHVRFVPKSRHF